MVTHESVFLYIIDKVGSRWDAHLCIFWESCVASV